MKKREHRLVNNIEQKWCPKCFSWRPLDSFRKDLEKWDGLYYSCKTCCQSRLQQYLNEPIGSSTVKNWNEKYYKENKETIKNRAKIWYSNNTEQAKENSLRSTKNRYHSKLKFDSRYMLNAALRAAIGRSLHGAKLGQHWEDLVGWTLLDLTNHLESLFLDGMNWNNYGFGHGHWVVHHCTIPLSAFDFKSAEDPNFRKVWSLTNLAPLWWYENLVLSDRFYKEEETKYK